MSKPRKPRPVGNRRPTTPPAKMESDKEQYGAYQWCKHELRQMHKTGEYAEDPEYWHPAARLARLAETSCNESLKALAYKVLLEYCEMPKAAEARLEAGINSPPQISIVIAPWAAGAQPRAIEHQPVPVDYVANDDAVLAHRGAPPPPPQPEQPAYQEMELRPDGGGVLRPAPVEQPTPDAGWKPRRYTYNEHTGLYDVEGEQ